MSDLIMSLGAHPVALVVAIILATFVLEDAASIGAALLASSGEISAPLAMAALMTGIFAGDLGLYGLGYAARSHRWAHARIGERHIERGRRWLNKRLLTALIVARFIPGARLPAYAASGYLQVPFARFASITAGAGAVWTLAVFAAVRSLGPDALIALGAWKWLIGAALLLLLLIASRLMEQSDV
jgi:membrane protein DedA with SNARE-associated domain